MTTIARFSTWKASTYVAGNLAFCAVLLFVLLRHPHDVSLRDYLTSQGSGHFASSVPGWLAAVFVGALQITILKQLLLERRSAVWIQEGNLVFLDTFGHVFFSRIALKEIQTISQKQLSAIWGKGLVARLNDGREVAIPTWLLEEPCETVEVRLNELIQTT